MDFPFGIETEAQIYLRSAQLALSQTSENTKKIIRDTAQEFKDNGFNLEPYDEMIIKIVEWTKENTKSQGWSLTDEDGVSWFLGLWSKAYELSLESSRFTFSKIFKDAFIKYFSQI